MKRPDAWAGLLVKQPHVKSFLARVEVRERGKK
jgi:hypothetical protein